MCWCRLPLAGIATLLSLVLAGCITTVGQAPIIDEATCQAGWEWQSARLAKGQNPKDETAWKKHFRVISPGNPAPTLALLYQRCPELGYVLPPPTPTPVPRCSVAVARQDVRIDPLEVQDWWVSANSGDQISGWAQEFTGNGVGLEVYDPYGGLMREYSTRTRHSFALTADSGTGRYTIRFLNRNLLATKVYSFSVTVCSQP